MFAFLSLCSEFLSVSWLSGTRWFQVTFYVNFYSLLSYNESGARLSQNVLVHEVSYYLKFSSLLSKCHSILASSLTISRAVWYKALSKCHIISISLRFSISVGLAGFSWLPYSGQSLTGFSQLKASYYLSLLHFAFLLSRLWFRVILVSHPLSKCHIITGFSLFLSKRHIISVFSLLLQPKAV